MENLNQALQELAAADLDHYSEFLSRLSSVDDQKRGETEKLLDAFGRQCPGPFVDKLIQVLANAPQSDRRSLAATLLRKVVPTGNPPMWANLDQAAQENLKSASLNVLMSERDRGVLSKVGNLISELVSKVLGVDDWPQVLPFVMQHIQSGSEILVEACLLIISEIAPVVHEAVKPDIARFAQLLKDCLHHRAPLISLAGLKATKAFVLALEDETIVSSFKLLMPDMLEATCNMHAVAGEELAVQAYSTIIEMVDEFPSFFYDHLPSIVGKMLENSQSGNLPMGIRNMAVEMLIVFLEMAKGDGEIPPVLQALLPDLINVLMDYMLDIQDDPSWYESITGEYDDDEAFTDVFSIGQTGVDRVACAAGGELLFPVLQQLIPSWTSNPDWRNRHAAMILIGQIADGCSEVMASQPQAMFGCCLQALNDPHTRVKWAACQTIGLLVPEIGSSTEDAQLIGVADALIRIIQDKSIDRLRQHGLRALIDVCGLEDFEISGNSLQQAVGAALEALKDGKKGTQDVALSCLSCISQSCVPGGFHCYYEVTMKVLHSMMTQRAASKDCILPVARILEAVGQVGLASGALSFSVDCEQIMAYVQEVLRMALALPEDNDERKEALTLLFGAGVMVAKTQQAQFANHINQFVPPLVSVLGSQLQVQICDAADWDEGMEMGAETIEVAGKILSVDTTALEHKVAALQAIVGFAESLNEHFPVSHISTLMEATSSLLGNALSKEVQELAVSAQPALLRCAVAAARNSLNVPSGFVETALNIQWKLLLEQLSSDSSFSATTPAVIGALGQIATIVEGVLGDEKAQAALTKVVETMTAFKSQYADHEAMAGEGRLSAEEEEELAEEIQLQTQMYDKLEDFFAAFLAQYGEKCSPYVETLMPILVEQLKGTKSPEVKQMVVILLTDIVDYSPQSASKFVDVIISALFEGSGSSHPGLRHCSCFGIGVVAQKAPEVFGPYAQQAVSQLMTAMNRDDARVDDFLSATDNAVSALGKVFEAHGSLVDVKLLVSTWLQFLPLEHDLDEALVAHEQLVRLVERMDVAVLGESHQNAGQLVRVMVGVLSKGDKLISKEVGLRMVNLLKHLSGVVPKALVDDAMKNMAEDEKENLRAFTLAC